jgi:hypothetical protein
MQVLLTTFTYSHWTPPIVHVNRKHMSYSGGDAWLIDMAMVANKNALFVVLVGNANRLEA